jgi:hypothetical protein
LRSLSMGFRKTSDDTDNKALQQDDLRADKPLNQHTAQVDSLKRFVRAQVDSLKLHASTNSDGDSGANSPSTSPFASLRRAKAKTNRKGSTRGSPELTALKDLAGSGTRSSTEGVISWLRRD